MWSRRRYLLHRAVQSLVMLWLVTLLVFLLLRLVPGDPAQMIAGDYAGRDVVESIRRALGLDRPLYEQYLVYMRNLLRGDMGVSIRAQRPALPYVLERLPATGELAVAAFGVAVAVGLPLGIVAAVRRRSLWDALASACALLGQSVPSYWLGLMLMVIFAVHLRLLPTSGRGSFLHLIMPGVTLASWMIGLITRLTRSGLLDVLLQDYIRTARAKGLPERDVVSRHALRNALIPIVTVLGLQIGTLLGGAVVTETVFAWPGMGLLVVQAVSQRDYPVVQAIVLLSALVFVVVNFAVDVLYQYLDPRISYEGARE
ncbi:MAG: ABC transporter permease [Armatimonadetes bacterium]|nr:ABC transporter permease [Armatimonadota bacterium]